MFNKGQLIKLELLLYRIGRLGFHVATVLEITILEPHARMLVTFGLPSLSAGTFAYTAVGVSGKCAL
jgi:hypothetical protein